MAHAPQLPSELTLDHVLDVVFGLTMNPATVKLVITTGPHVFVRALASAELADGLAALIWQRARAGESRFAVESEEVAQMLRVFFRRIFFAPTVDRIGADTAQAVQRTLHDTFASVARSIQAVHLSGKPRAHWGPPLDRALALLLELTHAVRQFLPSALCSVAWTDAHVLATVLEGVEASVLETLSGFDNEPLLVLLDGVLGFVMSEDDVVCERTIDLGSGFGACACSRLWRRVGKFAEDEAVASALVHTAAFNRAVKAAFTPPLRPAAAPSSLPPSRPLSPAPSTASTASTKRPMPSPDECVRHTAARTSCSGKSLVLRFGE
jgi:hypothetical protein